MRILLSAPASYSEYGSESAVAHHYARILGRRHDLRVLTAKPTDLTRSMPGIREVCELDAGQLNLNDVTGGSLLTYELRQWRPARRMVKCGVDVIHRVNPCAVGAPTLLAFLNRPLVVGPVLASPKVPAAFRDVLWREIHHYKRSAPPWRRLEPRRRLAHAILGAAGYDHRHLRRAHRILVGSALTMEEIPAALHPLCEPIVYAGVEHDVFTPPPPGQGGPRNEAVRLLYAGRLTPHKGVELLLRACAAIRRGRDFSLTLVAHGGEYFEAFVRSLTRDLGLAKRARFLPKVPRRSMPQLFREHDVFCFPTLTDTYGMVLLEAMASGMAVVASDIGGAAEIVSGDTGIRVPVVTPDQYVADYAGALSDLIDHASRRLDLGRAARLRILQRHDWETIGARLERLYETIA